MATLRSLAVVTLLATACGVTPAATGQQGSDRWASASPMTADAAGSNGDCPVTVPPQPGFVPPEPYPPKPYEFSPGVWYGSAALWTSLDPEGEIWEDLPEGHGKFGQKLSWWSENYSPGKGTLSVVGRNLDRPASFEISGPVGGGFREDVRHFMMVGVGFPKPGCWEVTATYGDAELSYVALIKD